MNRIFVALVSFALISCAVAQTSGTADAGRRTLRLYTLDCGYMHVADMSPFSDTGEFAGAKGMLSAPCFLVSHPKGLLLWDAGLGDAVAQHPEGVAHGNFRWYVPTPLVTQLARIGLRPKDIDYIAFSHLHDDHTGNANLFGSATWLMNPVELAWASTDPPPFGVDPATISAYARAKSISVSGDYDVFGDSSVVLLKSPGHTPGHLMLKLTLPRAGIVILSGDLYHLRTAQIDEKVPTFNVSRADTLASRNRVQRILGYTHARLIVQHDPDDVEALPKAPNFLQ